MERREEALEPAPSIIVTEKDGKVRLSLPLRAESLYWIHHTPH
jgi:hypothetical protein